MMSKCILSSVTGSYHVVTLGVNVIRTVSVAYTDLEPSMVSVVSNSSGDIPALVF